MFNKLSKFSLPELEERVLGFWRENQVFKTVEERFSRKKGGKSFVFYEGPPTANGKPGIHHILSRSFKDIVLRYKTMRGFRVFRRGGWDTHGLPVELEIEKKLGLKNKKDIEKYGIAEFNARSKESVWAYKDEWERLTERIGFWLNMDHPYVTYDNSYIETIWWILAWARRKKLLYQSYKVVPWCPRCGTALSSHELAQGYKSVTEKSVFVKFKLAPGSALKNKPLKGNVYILSWTTTPWTLPGNVALAVGRDIKYVLAKGPNSKDLLILAESLAEKVLGEKFEAIESFKGEDLVGLRYTPLFPNRKTQRNRAAYKVYPADFVTTEEGTGIVHTAVMYGEDDYKLGLEAGLPQKHVVGEDGKFNSEILDLEGLSVKSQEAEDKIIEHLSRRGYLYKEEDYTHDYPFCWRCSTPIIYYARHSWFLAMSQLKQKLIKENKKINWLPPHIKTGRFGEWLKNVKDWAISRERYWGTPLPIWQCRACGETKVISGYQELSDELGASQNRYLVMRHGESESNVKHIINSTPANRDLFPLTVKGRLQAEEAATKLKKEKIDLIIASDFKRTAETAQIVGRKLGVTPIFDPRLREINTGVFEGQSPKDYSQFFSGHHEKFFKKPPGGESLRDVAKRVWSLVNDLEKKHKGKTILFVGHEYIVWMAYTVMKGLSEGDAVGEKLKRGDDFVTTGEVLEIPLLVLPRNENGFFDPHKPFIDKVKIKCRCGAAMKRVPEVLDVWFDSGAMPFAQNHFPFDQMPAAKPAVTPLTITKAVKNIPFPADYIVEGVDQTRGWFYTLLATAALLDQPTPYRNAISLGLVLDKKGQKMSKSRGNAVDPWSVIDGYGADAVRWFFYTTNPPGEPKLFDEKDLLSLTRNFFMLIYNSFVFLDTYTANVKIKLPAEGNIVSYNLLDRWLLTYLNQTVDGVAADLDRYDITAAARRIERFATDLSRWYIRRSRARFQQPANRRDYESAAATLTFALLNLSKIIAPFTPFFAEGLYQSLIGKIIGDKEPSVHLSLWPQISAKHKNDDLLAGMDEIRRISALALAEREKAGVKLRQPLKALKLKTDPLKIEDEDLKAAFWEILKDEINVKEIIFDSKLKTEAALDTRLNHQLKEEGWLREFVRVVQRMRQEGGLEPKNRINIFVQADSELERVIDKNQEVIKSRLNAVEIGHKKPAKFLVEKETKIDEFKAAIFVQKVV